MSDFIDQFFGDAKRLRLSAVEKKAIWSTMPLSSLEKAEVFQRISKHMQRNPIPLDPTPSLSYFWHFHKLAASFMIALLILTAGSGTVAYAAEGTVPGDTLYTVKVGVTEPLIDMALSFDPERQAEWERRRIKRRLKEAEHLSVLEELKPEHIELLEQHVERRMERLEEHLEEVPEELQSLIQERVDDVMRRHEEFLEHVESGDIIKPEVHEFKRQMHDMRNRAQEKWGMQLPPPPPLQNPTENVQIHPPKELELPLEGWLSGRKRTTRNRVDEQSSRGFESPSLRQPMPSGR